MPFGRLASVSVRFPGLVMVILSGPFVLSCGFDESVTLSLTLEVPAVVGVPLMVQLLCANPAGSDVEGSRVQVNGAVPPVVRIVAKYGRPTVPFGRLVNDSDSPAGSIFRATGPFAVCCGLELSVTLT